MTHNKLFLYNFRKISDWICWG